MQSKIWNDPKEPWSEWRNTDPQDTQIEPHFVLSEEPPGVYFGILKLLNQLIIEQPLPLPPRKLNDKKISSIQAVLTLVPQEHHSYLQQIIQGNIGVPDECLAAPLPPLPIPELNPVSIAVTSVVDIADNPYKHAKRPVHAGFSKVIQCKKVK